MRLCSRTLLDVLISDEVLAKTDQAQTQLEVAIRSRD
jgi:hypothetical protein